VGASILPTAAINLHVCGDWTGLKVEQPMLGGGGKVYRFVANAVNLSLAQVVPPVFPFAQQWNALVQRTIPAPVSERLHHYLEGASAEFALPEMQIEEAAGLGFGVTIFLLATVCFRSRPKNRETRRNLFRVEIMIPLAAFAGMLIFMAQTGTSGAARYLLPFYPLLAAPLIAGAGVGELFRKQGWQRLGLLVFASAGLLLILSPARPLWPARTVLSALQAADAEGGWRKRAWSVYSAYAVRTEGFAPVIAALPPETPVVGFMAFDEPETSLWKPFGSRRVVHFRHDDTPEDLEARGLKIALVSETFLTQNCGINATDWLTRMRAEPVEQFELKLLAREPAHRWLLVRFK